MKSSIEDLEIYGAKFCVVPDKIYWKPIRIKKKNRCEMDKCKNDAFQICNQRVDLVSCGKLRIVNFHKGCKKMFCPVHARIYLNKTTQRQSMETFCCKNCEEAVEIAICYKSVIRISLIVIFILSILSIGLFFIIKEHS